MSPIHEQPPSKIGSRGKTKEPDGNITYFTILDEIRHPLFSEPAMLLCLHKIQHEHNGLIEIRFGYYIIGKRGKMKDKWVWGQFAPMMPIEDFSEVINMARERGWFKN